MKKDWQKVVEEWQNRGYSDRELQGIMSAIATALVGIGLLCKWLLG